MCPSGNKNTIKCIILSMISVSVIYKTAIYCIKTHLDQQTSQHLAKLFLMRLLTYSKTNICCSFWTKCGERTFFFFCIKMSHITDICECAEKSIYCMGFHYLSECTIVGSDNFIELYWFFRKIINIWKQGVWV